jgi:hypothetical protein
MGVSFGAGSDCNHALINEVISEMSVLPRYAAVDCVIRFNRPDLTVPNMNFQDTCIKAMFAAGGVTDNIVTLTLVV